MFLPEVDLQSCGLRAEFPEAGLFGLDGRRTKIVAHFLVGRVTEEAGLHRISVVY